MYNVTPLYIKLGMKQIVKVLLKNGNTLPFLLDKNLKSKFPGLFGSEGKRTFFISPDINICNMKNLIPRWKTLCDQ